MAIYSLWNNKGGVGKSYLTFQVAAEYARTHPDNNVLVIDLCPQANASGMLLGGIIQGETQLNAFASRNPRLTIAGYIDERIRTPYTNPRSARGMLPSYVALIRTYRPIFISSLATSNWRSRRHAFLAQPNRGRLMHGG